MLCNNQRWWHDDDDDMIIWWWYDDDDDDNDNDYIDDGGGDDNDNDDDDYDDDNDDDDYNNDNDDVNRADQLPFENHTNLLTTFRCMDFKFSWLVYLLTLNMKTKSNFILYYITHKNRDLFYRKSLHNFQSLKQILHQL